jgi:hypothetical protein
MSSIRAPEIARTTLPLQHLNGSRLDLGKMTGMNGNSWLNRAVLGIALASQRSGRAGRIVGARGKPLHKRPPLVGACKKFRELTNRPTVK